MAAEPGWGDRAKRIEVYATDFLSDQVRLSRVDVIFYTSSGSFNETHLEDKLLREMKAGAMVVVFHAPARRLVPLFSQLERIALPGLPLGVEAYQRPADTQANKQPAEALPAKITKMTSAEREGLDALLDDLSSRVTQPEIADTEKEDDLRRKATEKVVLFQADIPALTYLVNGLNAIDARVSPDALDRPAAEGITKVLADAKAEALEALITATLAKQPGLSPKARFKLVRDLLRQTFPDMAKTMNKHLSHLIGKTNPNVIQAGIDEFAGTKEAARFLWLAFPPRAAGKVRAPVRGWIGWLVPLHTIVEELLHALVGLLARIPLAGLSLWPHDAHVRVREGWLDAHARAWRVAVMA